MKLSKPTAVRFEVSVRAKAPSVGVLRREVVTEAVERWIEGELAPDGWTIRLVIWQGSSSREVNEIDDSARGESLRKTIRSAIKSGRLQIRSLGRAR